MPLFLRDQTCRKEEGEQQYSGLEKSIHRCPHTLVHTQEGRGSPSVSWLGLGSREGWFVRDSLGRRCRRRLLPKLSLLVRSPACAPCTPALLAHDPALFLTATAALAHFNTKHSQHPSVTQPSREEVSPLALKRTALVLRWVVFWVGGFGVDGEAGRSEGVERVRGEINARCDLAPSGISKYSCIHVSVLNISKA